MPRTLCPFHRIHYLLYSTSSVKERENVARVDGACVPARRTNRAVFLSPPRRARGVGSD